MTMPDQRRRTVIGITIAAATLGGACSMTPPAASGAAQAEVFAVERAFAKAMAQRDLKAFAELISEEAIFFDGTVALRGKAKVVEAWTPLFAQATAPFSWEPDQVEVLASGTLALSTGPVRNPGGQVIARFNSIWRLETPHLWRVVFDKGSPASPGP
jgi:ketosteroid isomerase-like protein